MDWRWAPNALTGILKREKAEGDLRKHRKEGHGKTKPEVEWCVPNPRTPTATRSWDRDMSELTLGVSRRNQPCGHPDFRIYKRISSYCSKPSGSFPGSSVVKNPPANAGDTSSSPVSGRSPGGRHGDPLQCSCLENPMDRGAWWATVNGVAKNQTRLGDWPHTHRLILTTKHFLKI